jgi:hypothetical protein
MIKPHFGWDGTPPSRAMRKYSQIPRNPSNDINAMNNHTLALINTPVTTNHNNSVLNKRAKNTLTLEGLAGAGSDMNKYIQATETATGNEI